VPTSASARPGLRAAQGAAVVGLAYTALSVAWGLGSTVLLDTVGGEPAAGGQVGRPLVVTALWVAVVLKSAAVVVPLVLVRGAVGPAYERIVSALTWIEAPVLTGYGG
jgi:hypothetical protein